MIVGTAGHIDHGKTALVKALTGVDADRLPEEKARGITLDLGYAYVPTATGEVLGFVDVPGHERLVHNMVAGVTGIDFVLLVIAADDGPMPQTREHLQIVDLLGLRRGAVALTKIDVVDAARLEAVRRDVQDLLRGTTLEGAPVFPLSSRTGAGVEPLQRHLEQAAASGVHAASRGGFRLAIDRCFTLKGAGVVVTGTVHAGSVKVGDELVLSPPGLRVRVRSLHAQDRPADVGQAGQRCALNLAGPGFEKALVRRGDWVVSAPLHVPVQRVDVQLRLLASEARPLAHWTPVHVHLGAADLTGRVALLESETLAAGAGALAQLVLDRAIGALAGDRFILRDQSAARTLGGGVVLDPFPPQRGRRRPARLRMLQASVPLDPRAALLAALEHEPLGIDLARFAVAWNLGEPERAGLHGALRMRIVQDGEARIALSEDAWRGLQDRVMLALSAEHTRAPDMVGVGRERLRRLTAPALHAAAYDAVLAELIARGAIAVTGAWLHDPAHHVRLTADEAARWQLIRPLLEEQPWQPPRVRDIARARALDEMLVRGALKAAARLGEVYPVAHDHYFTRAAVLELAGFVRELEADAAGATAATFRDRIGTGRKLAIHILEFFDRVGFTRRIGDRHALRNPALFSVADATTPAAHPERIAPPL